MDAVTEPTGVHRDLVLQRTLFSGPRKWVNDDLYSTIVRGVVRRTRHDAHLEAGAILDTNAYFGRFEASYWQRWTSVQVVTVGVEIETEGQLDVLVRASDIGSHVRTVDVVHHHGDGMAVLDVPVDTFTDGGAMWLEFVAVDAPAVVSDVRWAAETTRPVRRAAVAICTFNRADDCAATVASLAADPVVADLIDDLYVTDQGTDLVESREAFRAAAEELGDRLHYLRQPNLGGAGGFSRGLYEATAPDGAHAGDPVDVLLMDDDVRVEPETVLRLFAFAAVTREPTLVGAQMLYLYNPDYLLTSAERTDLSTLQGGLDADEWALRDVSVVEERQERRIDAEYNAWWSCLVPGEAVEQVGLPLPLFFQWDDIEFGLRCRRAGIPTVTLHGAAVWHADFYWKDGDDFGQFFGQRNSLVTAALRGEIAPVAMAVNLSRSVLRAIVGMQYGLAVTRLRGIAAFLDGPEGLTDGGQAALAEIRAERADHPETVRMGVDELPADIRVARKEGIPRLDREDQVLARRLLVQLLGRQRRGVVAVPYEDAAWWHVSLFDDVYVTDASQSGVRRRRVDPATASRLRRELAELMRRFVTEVPQVQQRWRDAQGELTSRANWERLYFG